MRCSGGVWLSSKPDEQAGALVGVEWHLRCFIISIRRIGTIVPPTSCLAGLTGDTGEPNWGPGEAGWRWATLEERQDLSRRMVTLLVEGMCGQWLWVSLGLSENPNRREVI